MDAEFAALSPADRKRAWAAISAVVEDSFTTHPMRHTTRSEVKRRCDFAVDQVRLFLRERKWSLDKALSHLRPELSAHLDTRQLAIRERTLYVPDEGLIARGIIAP